MKLLLTFLAFCKICGAILPFPRGSSNGYIVALAIPIDVGDRNSYVSYNFEANYVLPSRSTEFTQGLYDKILFVDGVEKEAVADQARKQLDFGFISRRNVYQMIEEKMKTYGMEGRDCLLRIICEVAHSNLHETNGVFGNLVHILLTPSSSLIEGDMREYTEAEKSTDCTTYSHKCNVSLLNAISVLME